MPARSTSLACCVLLAAVAIPLSRAWAQPADQIIFTSPSGSFSLREGRGQYLALHFLPGGAQAAGLQQIQEFAAHADEVAGVRHIYIKRGQEKQVADFRAKVAEAGVSVVVYRDEDAQLASALSLRDEVEAESDAAHAPAIILLTPDGTEAYRYVGKSADEIPHFAAFAIEMGRISKHPDLSQYNLPQGNLALAGYDAVSYIKDGKAQEGNAAITSTYRGVAYQFATRDHRRTFAADPEKYVPAYGGWCATAMGANDKVEVDPKNFKVTNGRLFLFYNGFWGNALKDWNKDELGLTRKADSAWRQLAPRD